MRTFQESWKIAKEMPGLVKESEMELLFSVIRKNKIKFAVEIGPLYGQSTTVIINALKPSARMVTIDNFAVNGSDSRPYFKKNVLPKYKGLELLEMSSNDATDFIKTPIDFLFIDGNHFDDGIRDDCINYLPKIRKGGIVAFHDYHNDLFPNVAKRVDQYTENWKTISTVVSLLIKKKP